MEACCETESWGIIAFGESGKKSEVCRRDSLEIDMRQSCSRNNEGMSRSEVFVRCGSEKRIEAGLHRV